MDNYKVSIEGKTFYTGCIEDHVSTDYVMRQLPMPHFGDATPHLKGSGEGKVSPLYKSLAKFDPSCFGDESQTTGDCTSHGCRRACDITRAVEIDIKGEAEGYYKRGATEAIYGYRGHRGAGMDPARASEFVNKYGILAREKHGDVDLSKYNASIGIGWGGRGVPDAIKNIAADRSVQTVSLVETVEEARDALRNGYGLHIGSSQGFSSTRDGEGFAAPRGSWSHDMAVTGCDFTPDRRHGFLIQNSWGEFNFGGHPWFGEIPVGSFMCDLETFARMMRSRGCWAMSNVVGFPAQNLPDWGTDFL